MTLSARAVTVDRSASITSTRPGRRKPTSSRQSAGWASTRCLSVASYGLDTARNPLAPPPRPPADRQDTPTRSPPIAEPLWGAVRDRRAGHVGLAFWALDRCLQLQH